MGKKGDPVINDKIRKAKYKLARLRLQAEYGTHFRYKGELRKFNYTRTKMPVGFIAIGKQRTYGYIHDGKFVAFKKDFRWSATFNEREPDME